MVLGTGAAAPLHESLAAQNNPVGQWGVHVESQQCSDGGLRILGGLHVDCSNQRTGRSASSVGRKQSTHNTCECTVT
jgi:hypothetical protein